MAGALDWLDPGVGQLVVSDALAERGEEPEQIHDEVRRHWIASAFPALRIAVALLAFSTAWLLGGLWLLVLIGVAVGLTGQALWRMITHHRDRFVITDRRVLRVHGNLTQVRASLPLTGIGAIEVSRPFLGRVFGYGHLRLVAAAHDLGLTEVRWVPDVEERVARIEALMDQRRVRP